MRDDAGSDGHAPGKDLDLFWTTRADAPLFDTFYVGYDQAFADGPEKETREAFRACLRLNFAPEHAPLSAAHGGFIEPVVVAKRPGTTEVIGGANFFLAHGTGPDTPTCNLNYIFIVPAWRGRGQFKTLLAAVRLLIANLSASAQGTAPLTFLEVSDPFRMANAGAGPDKVHAALTTAMIWAHAGARLVDTRYIQPSLSPDVTASETLAYATLNGPGSGLNARALRTHLERFFTISVAKGNRIDDQARNFLASFADGAEAIPILDTTPLLGNPERSLALLEGLVRPHSLAEAIRILSLAQPASGA